MHAQKIAIALVMREGRVLIGRRAPDTHLGGLWEFPGGKVEANETPEQAVARECHEECGIEIAVEQLHENFFYDYSDRRLELFFFLCRSISGKISEDSAHAWRWCSLSELKKYSMPPANQRVVAKLLEREAPTR